jgi:hypothetical protein
VSAGTIAVLVGIVWPAVACVVVWRVGRRLQGVGDRYPVADEWGPAFVCPGCAECTP